MHLYEAHLPVADTDAACRFYVEIVGLQFAHRDLRRDIVFLWAGANRQSMLGLWGPSTTLGRELHKCHIAFAVSLPELLAGGEQLNASGIQLRIFLARKRLSHPLSAGCLRPNCTSTTATGIRWSSSRSWTNHPSPALSEHSQNGSNEVGHADRVCLRSRSRVREARRLFRFAAGTAASTVLML